jgi:hypothetical protein
MMQRASTLSTPSLTPSSSISPPRAATRQQLLLPGAHRTALPRQGSSIWRICYESVRFGGTCWSCGLFPAGVWLLCAGTTCVTAQAARAARRVVAVVADLWL